MVKVMLVTLFLAPILFLTGCSGCGVNGQRCITSYTYVQTAPGAWTATAHYGE